MISLYHWLGGKARHAHELAGKIASECPRGGIYYEGFAGAASVAIVLGKLRPDIKLFLTDSNKNVVSALNYVKYHDDCSPVLARMQQILDLPSIEHRRVILHTDYHGDDPIKWLAAANSVRAAHNVWPYEPGQILARMRQLPAAWKAAHHSFANSIIYHKAVGYSNDVDVCYFDPPYYNSTFRYTDQDGDMEDWFRIYKEYMKTAQYILITDSIKAHKFYDIHMGLKPIETGKKLRAGIREVYEGDVECYYEWRRDPGASTNPSN